MRLIAADKEEGGEWLIRDFPLIRSVCLPLPGGKRGEGPLWALSDQMSPKRAFMVGLFSQTLISLPRASTQRPRIEQVPL